MEPKDVERQIRQMVDFIKLEAKEKASEIRLKTKADADLEKQMAVLNAKTKLSEEYDRKEKALAVEQRIKSSMEERVQRSRLLAARDEFVQKLGAEAKARLATAASSNQTAYGNLLKGLIKQGIVRLAGEAAVEVRARPQDLAVVQRVAPMAAAEVAAEAKASGEERSVTVTVVAWPALGNSAGGVQLASKNGTIRCDDTLEERLALVVADLTPVVRDLLFPSARAEVRIKPAVVTNPHSAAHKAAAAAAAPVAVKPQAPAATAPAAADPFAF